MADAGTMSCTTSVWVNSGNLQINNRCNIDIVVMLISEYGQCTGGGCQHYLGAGGYHIYTISGNNWWFSCASYETPRWINGHALYRCD